MELIVREVVYRRKSNRFAAENPVWRRAFHSFDDFALDETGSKATAAHSHFNNRHSDCMCYVFEDSKYVATLSKIVLI